MSTIRLRFITAVVTILSSTAAHSEDWAEVTGTEKIGLHSLIESALEVHWSDTSKGWCRATVNLEALDGRILEVDYSWSGSDLGMVLRDATAHRKSNAPVSEPFQICVFGAKESWVFYPHPKVNSLEGDGGKRLRTPGPYMDCRPHSIWLTSFGGQHPQFAIHKLFSDRVRSKLYQSPDSRRIQYRSNGMVIEFDRLADFSPVLFENHMDVVGVKRGYTPTREVYEVAQDSRDVWYCKHAETWTWRRGRSEAPDHRVVVDVLEYQSSPPKEVMRLGYNTIGANAETKVIARIPGRSGTWRYGKGESERDVEERMLRAASDKQRVRGFGKGGDK